MKVVLRDDNGKRVREWSNPSATEVAILTSTDTILTKSRSRDSRREFVIWDTVYDSHSKVLYLDGMEKTNSGSSD